MLQSGITLPSAEAQAENIRSAYSVAGLGFTQTGFVECHGTGTQAGDWRELKAISDTVSKDRCNDSPVVAGSVKPNIGHLEGAAGIAGMIKGVLVLEHGKIPPQANYQTPNPQLELADWKIKVAGDFETPSRYVLTCTDPHYCPRLASGWFATCER